jgi:methanogenesis imperfect marker protein 11
MENIADPYVVIYPRIAAITSEAGDRIELVEFFDCIGGAMWSKQHYAKSPIVESVRTVGGSMRYTLRPGAVSLALEGSRFPAGIAAAGVSNGEVMVKYAGLGGGGVGAAGCRSFAGGISRCESTPYGGGRAADATIWLPERKRVLIGVDDTDNQEEGATWTLVHNIARAVEDDDSVYLSHTIVQLFPVPYRTKNCVSIVCEFASSAPESLTRKFHRVLERYTLSDETGMAVYRGFDPAELQEFGWRVKRGEVLRNDLNALGSGRLSCIMEGRGIIGAVAAIPFYTRFDEALILCSGQN